MLSLRMTTWQTFQSLTVSLHQLGESVEQSVRMSQCACIFSKLLLPIMILEPSARGERIVRTLLFTIMNNSQE